MIEGLHFNDATIDSKVTFSNDLTGTDGSINIDWQAKNYAVVFAVNGGMCHIYVAELQGYDRVFWSHRERWKNKEYMDVLYHLCEIFSKYRGVELTLVRTSSMEYQIWNRSTKSPQPLSGLDGNRYPLFQRRIPPLAQSELSGDLLLVAQPGYYFEDKFFKGEHGTLSAEDSFVPLLVLSPGLNQTMGIEEEPICSADIMPTLAELLGFYDQWRKPGKNAGALDYDFQLSGPEMLAEIETLKLAFDEFVERVQMIKNPAQRELLSNLAGYAVMYLGLPLMSDLAPGVAASTLLENHIDFLRRSFAFGQCEWVGAVPVSRIDLMSTIANMEEEIIGRKLDFKRLDPVFA